MATGEGKTLVVETTNFLRETNFRGSSQNLFLVERFTRVNADVLLVHGGGSDDVYTGLHRADSDEAV